MAEIKCYAICFNMKYGMSEKGLNIIDVLSKEEGFIGVNPDAMRNRVAILYHTEKQRNEAYKKHKKMDIWKIKESCYLDERFLDDEYRNNYIAEESKHIPEEIKTMIHESKKNSDKVKEMQNKIKKMETSISKREKKLNDRELSLDRREKSCKDIEMKYKALLNEFNSYKKNHENVVSGYEKEIHDLEKRLHEIIQVKGE